MSDTVHRDTLELVLGVRVGSTIESTDSTFIEIPIRIPLEHGGVGFGINVDNSGCDTEPYSGEDVFSLTNALRRLQSQIEVFAMCEAESLPLRQSGDSRGRKHER